jgi:hypothetical protein
MVGSARGLRIFNYFEGEVEPPELIRVHRLARAKDKITINDYNDRKMTKYEDERTKAFALLYNLLQENHADILTNNTDPCRFARKIPIFTRRSCHSSKYSRAFLYSEDT